jgi:iron complex outermembrane receptor protein
VSSGLSTLNHDRLAGIVLLALAVATGRASAQSTVELKRMSLEELMNVPVTVVARGRQPANEVPAAIYVITQDDIRRSGATSLAEVLRLAPGVQVARQDAARYAVGIRGFADRLSRAILVLIDGRAVYSPLFAGTYWEVQDVFLEDVDRIEVIRGPGGTLWGANAVNGIISIVTKRAADTQGLVATAGAGPRATEPLGVRYGGAIGDRTTYRAYMKGFDRDANFSGAGEPFDDWRMTQGGGRADVALAGGRTLVLQGDAYAGSLGQRYMSTSLTPPFGETFVADAPIRGGNVRARWADSPDARSRLAVQAFYDRTVRREQPVGESRDTVDLDVQRQQLFSRHTLTFGGGYRVTRGDIRASGLSAFSPPIRTDHLLTAFGEGNMQLASSFSLIGGLKAEHNSYSGLELQPSVRVLWTVADSHRLFGSVTRAVRTPSRVETDYTTTSLLDPSLPSFVRLMPDAEFRSERLVAFELGYRTQPVERMFATISGFVNKLDDVLSTDLLGTFVETTPPPARIILPISLGNGLHGTSHGGELTLDWRTVSWLRTTASYSYVRVQLAKDPGGLDVSQERRGEGLSPKHQVQLQTSVDLPRGVELDWRWRYSSRLPAGPVPAYGSSDVRLGWHVNRRVELALVGQDLEHAQHLEWIANPTVNVRRSGYVALTVRQ